jgi:voltage-dependent potassium channel beta subunit
MEYRRLGNSGLKISSIALGGWTTFGGSIEDNQLAERIIDIALEGGVNFFDQADVYASGKSETMMGAILKKHDRNKLVISSKCYWPFTDDINGRGLSRKHIMNSIDGSLKRLQTDYLDIYFCHRYDLETPLEETVNAMTDLVRQGKILYWGTSEWSGAQIAEAVGIAKASGLVAPVTEQPHYSMVHRTKVETEILPVTEKHGIGLVCWSPLGMGVLTGKFDDGEVAGSRLSSTKIGQDLRTPEIVEKVRQLKPIADELGISRTTLALAWVLRHKGVSCAIVGATSEAQITENLKGSGVKLEADVLEKIDGIVGMN